MTSNGSTWEFPSFPLVFRSKKGSEKYRDFGIIWNGLKENAIKFDILPRGQHRENI